MYKWWWLYDHHSMICHFINFDHSYLQSIKLEHVQLKSAVK